MSTETNDTTEETNSDVRTEERDEVLQPEAVQPTPEPVQSRPTKRRSRNALLAFVSVLGALVLIGLGTAGGFLIAHNSSPNATPSLTATTDGNATVTPQENSIAAVAEKVGPSVVSIVTQTQTSGYSGSTSGEAAGTGIIVSKDGYVMTNNHVIDGAKTVSVVDSAGNLYSDISIIGRDPLNDVAFLKIKSDKTFTPATLGSSSTIRTGQEVVAIGNALGQYSNSVTSGIISGTGRPVTASSDTGSSTESLTDLIQTDASINPGNSGGPLVNMAGQVIGVNTAIVQNANGIGFAIPINSTKGVLAGVLETGKISRAFLGVSYLTVTPDVARQYNLAVNVGAYVYSDSGSAVGSGSPADKAGLKQGDVITKINDETVGTQGSLSTILGEYRPGDKITIVYLRDGKQNTVTLNLGTYNG